MTGMPEIDPPPIVTVKPSPEADDSFDWEVFDAEEKSKKLTSSFCNRLFVQPDAHHLRLCFGEKIGDDTAYHTAMIIPNANALEIGRLIVSMAEAGIDNQIALARKALAEIDSQESDELNV